MRSAGAILLSDRADRAVFIQPDEIAAFREMTALILRAPTVSGPPLVIEALRHFAEKLDVPETVADVTAPIEVRLSTVDEQILMLLRHQIAVREKLPLRIRRTCVTCGDTKIENPNMVVKSKLYENTGSVAGAVLETVGLIAEGHHIRAVIKVMGSVSTIVGKNQEDIPACGECQGQQFDTPAVTYCPHCRKLRAETVLIECTDCGASFIDDETLPEGWQERQAAYAAFRLAANAELFAAAAPRFEGKLNTDQRRYLESTFTADDILVAMCRCGRPGEQMRAVALLLTTRQLIWARQLRTGSNTGGWLPWSSVTSIRLSGLTVADTRVIVEAADSTLTFTGFKGTGVTFDNRATFFHPDGVAFLMGELSGVAVTRDVVPQWPTPAEIASASPVSASPVSASPVSALPVSASSVPASSVPASSVSGVPVSGVPSAPDPAAFPLSTPVPAGHPSPVVVAFAQVPPMMPVPSTAHLVNPSSVVPDQVAAPEMSGGPAMEALTGEPAQVAPTGSTGDLAEPAPVAVAAQPAAPAMELSPSTPQPVSTSPVQPAWYPATGENPAANQYPPANPAPQYAPAPPATAHPAAAYPAYQPPPQLDFSAAEPPPPPATPGWYADPFGLHRYRWWDGVSWTKMFFR